MNGRQIVALVIASLATGCATKPQPGSLQERLDSLMSEPKSPPVKITSACCYAPPKRFDLKATTFVCPSCSLATRYPSWKSCRNSNKNASQQDYDRLLSITNLPNQLNTAKKLLADMHTAAVSYGLTLEVDALDLCPSCRHSPTDAAPSLYLTVIREDGSCRQTPCSLFELQILQHFLTAQTWKPRHEYDIPLRNQTDIIEKLLGIRPS